MIIVIILIVLVGIVYLIMNSSTQSVTTQQNIFKLDDIYKPITTLPPKTQPSLTSPPFTQPPSTQPSFTQTPFTQSPSTQPSFTQPSFTQPSITRPSFTQPPSTQSSITRPPFTSQPTTTQPPTTRPPTTQPPAAPIDCVVSDWSNWGACTQPCGGGTQQRAKLILTLPQNGGRACPNLIESQTCNTQTCDCVVSDWSNWGACSKNCGGGTQQRTKSITRQPQNGGRACPPSAELTQSQSCNTHSCPKPPPPRRPPARVYGGKR